jgi:dimethylargininase
MRIALTRDVSPSLADCQLSYVDRGPIDVERARRQHAAYEAVLASLGCRVERVSPAPGLPDGVFVEDTAIVLDEAAIVARPGAASRRPEVADVAQALVGYRTLVFIEEPGTLDGGDVLVMGRRLFVGRSSRTNDDAIDQLDRLLTRLGYEVRPVDVERCLHLKSAVTAIAGDRVLVNPRWVDPRAFEPASALEIEPGEAHAANVLLVNEQVVVPSAHEGTRRRLEADGRRVVTVDVSELAKAEGGVTCCSLIFEQTPGSRLQPRGSGC